MTVSQFQDILHTIPSEPGIYKYFDKSGELLYVGKAKNLRKRIRSYFSKIFTGYKTHELVQRIQKIEFTIVNSEQDAFLLENSLIKQFQPKFNINLKDDKSYPYIIIKKENFPRIFLTRKKINDGSEYLGPFTSAGKVRELISFIRQYIPLRTCKLPLTQLNIQKKKFKVCLEYHLGNCKGPCEGLQSESEYAEGLQQIRQLLKGNLTPVIQHYKQQMKEMAVRMEFEKAEQVKKKIDHLENYQEKSVIVSKHLTNLDIFSILIENDIAWVNYLMVLNGTIVQTHSSELQTKLGETKEEVLQFAIANIREIFNSPANEIVVPLPVEYPDKVITITVPKGGDKKKLLELSVKNVHYFKDEMQKKKILHTAEKLPGYKKAVLYKLQQDLHLPELPLHIECFDNSNFQGTYPVSAMVCFKDGVPNKKEYRHFNVKTVEGINDFATMQEVVFRRYKRLLNENMPLPQLIIIDGGKGQLNADIESIRQLNLTGRLTVIGLAKNEEEIFFAGDSDSIRLPWNSESLKLIRLIRDEVHRFGINFHRLKRSKGSFSNELEQIRGIGKQTTTQLLQKFKSVKNIRLQSLQELEKVVGKAKAKIVWEHLQK